MASPATDAPFVFTAGMAAPGADFVGGMGAAGVGSGGGGAGPAADDLVRQTRREIAEIVREVAAMTRTRIDQKAFFAGLLDRTVRALAAEGAVIWDLGGERPAAVLRTGRVTDLQITGLGRDAHDRMLAEVAASGNPVVVPPTPIDPHSAEAVANLPANPTRRPAAVVPILDPLESENGSPAAAGRQGSRYVLEVFLEPEAGVATQRGYLRFTAQMADMAGDFLRLDEIRRARLAADANERLNAGVARLYRHTTVSACAAEIVDSVADWTSAARVTLVRMGRDGRAARILGISHVESIDHRGAACGRLRERIAATDCSPGQTFWTAPMGSDGDAALDRQASGEDADLYPVAMFAVGRSGEYRLLIQADRPSRLGEHDLGLVESFAAHAGAALRSAATIQSIPMAKVWLSLFVGEPGEGGAGTKFSWMRKGIVAAVAVGIVAMAGWIPATMNVTVPATLVPEGVRTHYAPADATVREVLVRHGDRVAAGQVLMVLHDFSLDEQTTTLIGRRAVVSEKLARVIGSLVSLPVGGGSGGGRSAGRDESSASDDALVQQQRLLEEEQRGIDQQLELLAEARERLVIRADRDGKVDAWQTELLALGRPVRTGESLVRVEPFGGRWVVDGRVPQNRRQLVIRRVAEERHRATVRFGDDSSQTRVASFVRHLGFEPSADGSPPVAVVQWRLEGDGESEPPADWQNGTPVEVTVDCGRMPLVQVLFFDLIRSVRLQWAKWI
jgi:PAS domain-containing protein